MIESEDSYSMRAQIREREGRRFSREPVFESLRKHCGTILTDHGGNGFWKTE